jgi:hypothetical protein
MLKHGLENITWIILESVSSENLLDEAEQRWITQLEGLTNIRPGGGQSRGWKMPPGSNSGARNPMYGVDRRELMVRIGKLRGPMSQENRSDAAERLVEFRKNPEWDKRRIEKLRESKNTPEYKRSASQRMTGIGNPRYGKRLTVDESRALSISKTPFTEKDIREIRRRKDSGDSQKEIANDYGVDPSTISRIANRSRFEWVV